MRMGFDLLVYGFLFLVLPFYLAGLTEKIKAVMAGRYGRALLQPLYDFLKLLRKAEVRSSTASPLADWAPILHLAAVIAAGLLVPLAGRRAVAGFAGDFVLFAYLLALARFLVILNALDVGSSFEGMGAAREALYGLLAEPILFILLGTLTLLGGEYSFDGWLRAAGDAAFGPALALSGGFLLFAVLLVEACRVPFDDPNTHLELTMVHEVMILDNSGPGLAFLSYGGYLKTALIVSLIAGLFRGPSNPWAAWGFYLAIVSAVGVLIGMLESVLARVRLQIVPQLLLGVSGLALVVYFTVLLGGN